MVGVGISGVAGAGAVVPGAVVVSLAVRAAGGDGVGFPSTAGGGGGVLRHGV